MTETVEWPAEQQLTEAFVNVLSKIMAKANWHYDHSGDLYLWYKGQDETKRIVDDLKALARLDGGLYEAKKLWEQYVPERTVSQPKFLSNPKLLNSILDGQIRNEDAHIVQKVLLKQQNKLNRFVVFDNDPLSPPKSRFIGFRDRLDARLFIEKKEQWSYRYDCRSIAYLEQEIKHVVEPDKRRCQHDVETRLEWNQFLLGHQRSRGEELSR